MFLENKMIDIKIANSDIISINLIIFLFLIKTNIICPPSKKCIGSILKTKIIRFTHRKTYKLREKSLDNKDKELIIKNKFTSGPQTKTNSFLAVSVGYRQSLNPNTDISILGFTPHKKQADICPNSCIAALIIRNKNIFSLSKTSAKKIPAKII